MFCGKNCKPCTIYLSMVFYVIIEFSSYNLSGFLVRQKKRPIKDIKRIHFYCYKVLLNVILGFISNSKRSRDDLEKALLL